MSVANLNRFIGNAIISDRTREWAMGGRLADVLQENELENEEIAEIVSAQPQSLTELCALVERMVTLRESATARGEMALSRNNMLLGLRVTGPAVT